MQKQMYGTQATDKEIPRIKGMNESDQVNDEWPGAYQCLLLRHCSTNDQSRAQI